MVTPQEFVDNLRQHWMLSITSLVLLILTVTFGVFEWLIYEPVKVQIDGLRYENSRLQAEIVTLRGRVPLDDIVKTVSVVAGAVLSDPSIRRDSTFTPSVEVTEIPNGAQTSFHLDHTVNFDSGEYSLNTVYEDSNFVAAVTTFMLAIRDVYEDYEVDLVAKFVGGADAASAGQIVGIYDGKYGTILLPNAFVNGQKRLVHLELGEDYDNGELSIIRAYSVRDAFFAIARAYAMKLPEDKIEYRGKEYPDYGPNFRFGRVIIDVVPKKI